MAATAILLKPTTPPDYHRIVSSQLVVPTDTSVSVPVGLLACQRDPLQRTLVTSVVQATLSNSTSGKDKNKTGKKAVIAPALPPGPILELVLHDTVIFPEGGGQPTDTGKILVEGRDKLWSVLQAKRQGGHAVHYVEIPGGDVDGVLQTFKPGTTVTVTLDDQDYNKRYDHMSMHTSQHLLSALLETRLNLPTLSWSLTSYPAPCYVEVPRGLTSDEILAVQNEANRLVFEGRRVHVEVDVLEESQPRPTDPANSRSVGKGLPDDYTGGVKRIVVIEGVDRNPCCGTHLPSIHNLQLFLLPHTEALSRSSTTSARLYFLAGPRLIDHLAKSHGLLTQSAALLSCGAPLLPERLGQVIDDRKRADKRVGELEIELAGRIAQDLVQKLASEKAYKSVFSHHLHRTEDSANPLGFLSSIATSVLSTATASNLHSTPFVFVLTSSPSSQTSTSVTTVLVTSSNGDLVKSTGDLLKAGLGVKGGGKGTKWSGKYIGVWKETKEGKVVAEILQGLKQ
ncbi:alanyl-tRNA synthetase domain-containing protein [Coprinopsis cinerea okayama7|uniref:Alanyl-tRNA synthetase domain-containing protein n=1 Tax=Coprinopsis cinerea (strain Okayama-7 / 130 / ATCC MYA-4618 / FGSC 9003) TaxID=240176 RepID=A8NXC8_COPC7|nr:alanyl-tRNA synthetase domain-containing protein [Coprinopsis cinerea okayama7\|eukprot:XP_001837131.2 alanyl-tRNA synthetase domain-containing protein [Coprinopsis cinerea okayama7\